MKVLKIISRYPAPELAIILVSSLAPLLFEFPYRINLFLAWDGAYRLSEGLIPFRDFGTPVGYVFWILPGAFFKLFGPSVFTLLAAQSVINLTSNWLFYQILTKLKIRRLYRFSALVVFILTFSIFNIWPWYNHFVVVLEMAALYFLLTAINAREKIILLTASGLFCALAFMTKQDTGALSIVLCGVILLYQSYHSKSIRDLMFFSTSFLVSIGLLVVPFLQYEFSYWFNLGQFPHNSRISAFDIIHEFLGASVWIKFYLLMICFIVISRYKDPDWLRGNATVIIVSIFILFQASIIQVTSYTPAHGNVYFHAFSFAVLLHLLDLGQWQNYFQKVVFIMLVALWCSGVTWNRFLSSKVRAFFPKPSMEEISKNTFLNNSGDQTLSRNQWIVSDIPTFERVKLPVETVEGIKSIGDLADSLVNPRVLNMTEITQLSYILSYEIERGQGVPLWYHKGVAFFDREVARYCEAIKAEEYDIILFEDIPDVNNFYPYEVLDCIESSYKLRLEFKAPRVPEISRIKVYIKSAD